MKLFVTIYLYEIKKIFKTKVPVLLCLLGFVFLFAITMADYLVMNPEAKYTVAIEKDIEGKEIDDILKGPIDSACEYVKGIAGSGKRVLLLKGPSTIITDGNTTYITDTGCPGMATAGSGDVLSGILSATCAYIPDLTVAVTAGAYINGRAGELAEEERGAGSMIAGDTVDCISEVIN